MTRKRNTTDNFTKAIKTHLNRRKVLVDAGKSK